MKKCCAGLAVVLVSFVAFGVGNAQTPFRGVINPNTHSVWVDSAIVTLPITTYTFRTPGWGSDSVALDTFDFPVLPHWPVSVRLLGSVDGSPNSTLIPSPVADTWYPFEGVIDPAPMVMFNSTTGVEESRVAIEPLQRLYVSPSVVTAQMTVRLQPAGTGRRAVGIHDAVGNLIRSLNCTAGAGGIATATWNREDEFGRLVPEGVYFCRYAASGVVAVRKILVAH